jgi:hypothetical protein
VTNFGFGQNQYFFSILYSISRESLIASFYVKWQTNILEQFSVFWPFFFCLFLGEFTKLFVKNTKIMEMLQTIAFFIVKLAYRLIFDTFRVIKNLFDHLFEHNLNLFFSKQLRLTGRYLKKYIFVNFFVLHKYSTQY